MVPNPSCKSSRFSESTLIGIRHAWTELRRQEATLSPALAEGLARRRSALLADVEPWRLPDLLDELSREEVSL